MKWSMFLPYLAVTAGVTYLIRMLPLTVFRREIKSRFVRSLVVPGIYPLCGAGSHDFSGCVLLYGRSAHGHLRCRGGGAAGLAGTEPADGGCCRLLRGGAGPGIPSADLKNGKEEDSV